MERHIPLLFEVHEWFVDGTIAVAKRGLRVGKTMRSKGMKLMVITDANGILLAEHTTSTSPHEVLPSKIDWTWMKIRHQTKGKLLFAWFHCQDIYKYNPIMERRKLVTLLIRKDVDGTIKYSLCYHPGATLRQLAYMQCKRYFIEKLFREAKKELGWNQYQKRSPE